MFIAINYITCQPDYQERFEELFATRAGAIDRMTGFRSVKVLRPKKSNQPYLIMSEWDNEKAFKSWTKSAEFVEGHRRGFADLEAAQARGEEPPMQSSFITYEVIAQ